MPRRLTKRENEIAHRLVEGDTNQQIADRLTISIQTVKYHINHILKACNVENRYKLIVKYHRNEIINLPLNRQPLVNLPSGFDV